VVLDKDKLKAKIKLLSKCDQAKIRLVVVTIDRNRQLGKIFSCKIIEEVNVIRS
jgi:hypothetical protein